MEEEIILPISKKLLKEELTAERQLRMTNKSHNEIYVVTAKNAPNVMKEIGRLREEAFRTAGGGTGKSMDIDEFDTMENGCRQLIVWNPEAQEIIGGYRYLFGEDWEIDDTGQPILATSHMFHFSDKFMKEYAPMTVELGLYFLNKHFDDKDNLVIPIKPLQIDTPEDKLKALFTSNDFKEDYRILNREIRRLGDNIPPLVNAYMNLSPTMKLFGTAINYGFGDVEETGILIAVDEILEQKRIRHIDSYVKEHPEAMKITSGANQIIYKEKNDAE